MKRKGATKTFGLLAALTALLVLDPSCTMKISGATLTGAILSSRTSSGPQFTMALDNEKSPN